MLSYSHMTIWANQSWPALGLDWAGFWSKKIGMVLVRKPLVQKSDMLVFDQIKKQFKNSFRHYEEYISEQLTKCL